MASPLAPVEVVRLVMVGGAEVTVLPDASVVVTTMAEVASVSMTEAEGEARTDVGAGAEVVGATEVVGAADDCLFMLFRCTTGIGAHQNCGARMF